MFTRQRANDPRWNSGDETNEIDDSSLIETIDKLKAPDLDSTNLDLDFDSAALTHSAAADRVVAPPGNSSRNGDRYQLGKFLDAGGLGEVYSARDRELDREVVVKQVKEKYRDSSLFQKRLIREARITAALEHPGIVPVHGLCRHADGYDFYVMRKVDGMRMDKAVRIFHRCPPLDYKLSSDFRSLLRRFIQVCETVQYAHSQGVIHRDVKPENIMFRRYGETLLLDWGLAKIYEDVSPASGSPRLGLKALVKGLIDSDQLDSESRRCGTLANMSPEQLLATNEKVGPRSDVFSLGATLYQILTGVAPVRLSDQEDREVALLLEEVIPARGLNPDAPRPLEAICSKAMRYLPSERYQSAGEMAKDVQRWLDDEAVSSDAEPITVRLARLFRRRQTYFVTAFGVLSTALATVSVAYFLVNRTLERAVAAEKKAEKALTDENIARNRVTNIASAAVDNLHDIARFSAPTQAIPMRKAIVERNLNYLKRLEAMSPDDPNIKSRFAENFMEAALLSRLEGDLQSAEEFGRLSANLWAGMLGSRPNSFLDREYVVRELARDKVQQGLPREARELCEASIERLEAGPPIALPITGRKPFYKAMALEGLSFALEELGEFEKAIEAARKADALWESMIAEDSLADLGQHFVYLMFRASYADLLHNVGKDEEALAIADANFEKARLSLNSTDNRSVPINVYCGVQLSRFMILRKLNRRLPETRSDLAEVIAMVESLAEESPTEHAIQAGLADAYLQRGLIAAAMDDRPQAMADVEHARGIVEKLLEKTPQVVRYRIVLAEILGEHAKLRLRTGDVAEVEPMLQRAVALESEVLKLNPDNPYGKRLLKAHQEQLEALKTRKL